MTIRLRVRLADRLRSLGVTVRRRAGIDFTHEWFEFELDPTDTIGGIMLSKILPDAEVRDPAGSLVRYGGLEVEMLGDAAGIVGAARDAVEEGRIEEARKILEEAPYLTILVSFPHPPWISRNAIEERAYRREVLGEWITPTPAVFDLPPGSGRPRRR